MSDTARKLEPIDYISGEAHHEAVSGDDTDAEFLDLEEIKFQWQSSLDAISDPIAIIDSNYNIRRSNIAMAEFTTHKDVKRIVGEKSYAVFAGLEEPCAGCLVPEVFASAQQQEYMYERADGKVFEISCFPLTASPGSSRAQGSYQVKSVVQVYRDRTLHNQIQAKIRQHDKLTSLGLLASGIAHEINNPLSGILLFSQMLLKELSAQDEHYGDVVEIEAAAQRCREIVRQVLEFSRQSSGSIKQKEELSLREIIQSAERFSRVLKIAKESRVIYTWDQAEIKILGWRGRLIQVFINIFKNAFQAMPDGGEIFVSQWQECVDGKLMVGLELRDTGVGIAKEHLERIFDPFFTTKNDQEGTGLGLAISYGIIRELDGELTVTSTCDEGTTIRVYLPSASAYPPLREVTTAADEEHQGQTG